jgi:competence protein ComEA
MKTLFSTTSVLTTSVLSHSITKLSHSKIAALIVAIGFSVIFLFSAVPVQANSNEMAKQSSKNDVSKAMAVDALVQIISLNKATLEQLVSLKGVGEKKAQAIIAYRDTYGDFKSIDDLVNVKGIGMQIVSANKERLKI